MEAPQVHAECRAGQPKEGPQVHRWYRARRSMEAPQVYLQYRAGQPMEAPLVLPSTGQGNSWVLLRYWDACIHQTEVSGTYCEHHSIHARSVTLRPESLSGPSLERTLMTPLSVLVSACLATQVIFHGVAPVHPHIYSNGHICLGTPPGNPWLPLAVTFDSKQGIEQ